MRVSGTTLAFCALLGSAVTATKAEAARTRQDPGSANGKQAATAQHGREAAAPRRGRSHGGISCVPYARSVTGMAIFGNGGDWWYNAAGNYDRGHRPEPGSVMAFRATGGMSRGHVAVVRRVMGPRHVLIDHANWGGPGIRKGTVMQNVSVIDVSDRNDWTAVRVQVGHDSSAFGRVYPTYGFIYDRPDGGTGTAYAATPVQRSLRFQELAEMPVGAQPVSFQMQGAAPLRKPAPQRQR
ncbi:CHAP domain-containing protein [Roseicella aerolata]|uniref:CHAP domain-containing protein n=1 Tax=Roseicella aerolata TaxID=2883479 RepID=A0A9X1L9E1_9PROT|nr:CHAP domain-containing protein [Roseicella aerolata]MCB4821003.1 CHAP domain-containing protein [Roseicella aerolata]